MTARDDILADRLNAEPAIAFAYRQFPPLREAGIPADIVSKAG
jgi:hypothetical protein